MFRFNLILWISFDSINFSGFKSVDRVASHMHLVCVLLFVHISVFCTYKSINQEKEREGVRKMSSEKKSAHVWVRQNAPVKIYSSISVNVWERKNQLICILLYYPLFSCLPLHLEQSNGASFASELQKCPLFYTIQKCSHKLK